VGRRLLTGSHSDGSEYTEVTFSLCRMRRHIWLYKPLSPL
jgi:hypothetical protein